MKDLSELSVPHAPEPCLHHRESLCPLHMKWNRHCRCGKPYKHAIHLNPKDAPIEQTAGRAA